MTQTGSSGNISFCTVSYTDGFCTHHKYVVFIDMMKPDTYFDTAIISPVFMLLEWAAKSKLSVSLHVTVPCTLYARYNAILNTDNRVASNESMISTS